MLEKELAAAIEAVTLASKLCTSVQEALVDEQNRHQKGPLAGHHRRLWPAQAITSHVLRRHFPDIPIVGEEKRRCIARGR